MAKAAKKPAAKKAKAAEVPPKRVQTPADRRNYLRKKAGWDRSRREKT